MCKRCNFNLAISVLAVIIASSSLAMVSRISHQVVELEIRQGRLSVDCVSNPVGE